MISYMLVKMDRGSDADSQPVLQSCAVLTPAGYELLELNANLWSRLQELTMDGKIIVYGGTGKEALRKFLCDELKHSSPDIDAILDKVFYWRYKHLSVYQLAAIKGEDFSKEAFEPEEALEAFRFYHENLDNASCQFSAYDDYQTLRRKMDRSARMPNKPYDTLLQISKYYPGIWHDSLSSEVADMYRKMADEIDAMRGN